MSWSPKSTDDLAAFETDGVRAIDRESWDALTSDEDVSPFLRYGFLASLEEAGTVVRKTGWVPKFVALKRGSTVVAAAPAYLKFHSQGEFVFDFAFAELATKLGLRYYPKLLVGVPFTPVTGRRLLTRAGEDRDALELALARAILEAAREHAVSSVHVNFAREDEVRTLGALGFVERHGVQYHWYRRGAKTIDDYLARFKSKRRNVIKREMRAADEQGLTLERLDAHALDDETVLETVFELYRSTVAKFYWGRQYLNLEFFRRLREAMADAVEVIVARDRRQIVAGAINIAGRRVYYGRYWGAFEQYPFLHFNVCYYRGVRECIERGIDVFEPGAGGEHKRARGFEPTITRSAHWFSHETMRRAITPAIDRERAAIAEMIASEEDT